MKYVEKAFVRHTTTSTTAAHGTGDPGVNTGPSEAAAGRGLAGEMAGCRRWSVYKRRRKHQSLQKTMSEASLGSAIGAAATPASNRAVGVIVRDESDNGSDIFVFGADVVSDSPTSASSIHGLSYLHFNSFQFSQNWS